jgi:hypothetical protein
MVQGQRPALALVPDRGERASSPSVSFCSHCGKRPDQSRPTRVCEACGFGLLLQCAADVAPQPGQPFIVLDGSMAVCAVSAGAEALLATTETDAIHHHVTELLVPADAEADARHNLAAAVSWAARGDGEPRKVFVRPANMFGVRLSTRVTSCGPPRAALLVFEAPRR